MPWAAREAEIIADLFDSDVTLKLTGEYATRNALLGEVQRRAKVLHIATHGYFAEDSADNVGFVLVSEGEQSSLVTLTELLSYEFSNDLVVVSGCDTAMGETFSGEGHQSVSRAFLARGGPAVIGTPWPVSDRASSAFMELFYTGLSEHGDPSVALREAQLGLRRNPRFHAPLYWAAYVLTTVHPGERIAIGATGRQ